MDRKIGVAHTVRAPAALGQESVACAPRGAAQASASGGLLL